MMPTFSNYFRVFPISMCPSGNVYCLIFVTPLGIGRAMGGCLPCPLRTFFTTCTLSLNSPAMVCNHGQCVTSTPKIYSGMREMYTVYSFGGKHPIPNGIWAFFSLIALPHRHLSQQGSQENVPGCHTLKNTQLLFPPHQSVLCIHRGTVNC